MDIASLLPNRVDLWVIDPGGIDDRAIAAYEGLLSQSERVQYARFISKEAQRLFLVARALIRTTLSRYWPISPYVWQFATGPYGRPYIQSPWVPWLHFNLSHTAGMVVCAVSADETCGVDVERIDRDVDYLSIAPTVFSVPELSQLHAVCSPDRQREMFFRLWTLKEAYVKATGQGLSAQLDRFWFDVQGSRARMSFAPDLTDDPLKWLFWEQTLTAVHRLAVAKRISCVNELNVTIRHIDPMDVVRSARGWLKYRNLQIA